MRSVEECYRGRDVRVFRLDQAAVMARLRERAQAVLQRRADVVAIKLFGSLARDQGRPGSDADLFVVVRDGAGMFLDRIAGLAREFSGLGIGCDVVVFTESETREARARGDAFARVVCDESVTLATREGG